MVGLAVGILTSASILTFTPAARALQLTATETTLKSANCPNSLYSSRLSSNAFEKLRHKVQLAFLNNVVQTIFIKDGNYPTTIIIVILRVAWIKPKSTYKVMNH